MVEAMPFTGWVARTWGRLGAGGRAAFAAAFAIALLPFWALWLPADLAVGAVRTARRAAAREAAGGGGDGDGDGSEVRDLARSWGGEARARAARLEIDPSRVAGEPSPVGGENWPLVEELVRRVNAALPGTPGPSYRHPVPRRGEMRDFPPDGARAWRGRNGQLTLRAYGTSERPDGLFDRLELTARFRGDGSPVWVESRIRVYRPEDGLSDPWERVWRCDGGRLVPDVARSPERVRDGGADLVIRHERPMV